MIVETRINNDVTLTSMTAQVSRQHVRQVLRLAVQAGEILLRSGAEVARVEETINIIVKAFGLDYSNSIVTPTGLYVSIDNGYRENDNSIMYPVTVVRRVRNRVLNYNRISAVNALSRRVTQGMVTLEQAVREVDRINHAPDLYPFWIRLLVGAGSASGATVLLGGTLFDVAPGFVSTILAQLLNWLLARTKIPAIFSDFFGAVLATSVALLLFWLGLPIQTNLVIAGGLIQLVPGSALVASVQDGISGDLISSAARGLEALLKGAAIASGVGLALTTALNLHITVPASQSANVATWQVPVQVVAAGFAAACYAIYSYIPRFAIFTTGFAGGAGWLTHIFIVNFLSGDGLLATFLAAFLAGLLGWRLARWQHAPTTLYILPGILPLLPGLSIYNAMLSLSQNQNQQGLLLLIHAIFLSGALAAGVALSNSLSLSLLSKIKL